MTKEEAEVLDELLAATKRAVHQLDPDSPWGQATRVIAGRLTLWMESAPPRLTNTKEKD